MAATQNKLKVTLTEANAGVLATLGSLIPGVGTSIEKIIKAAAASNGLATTGNGTIANHRLRFVADNFASWMLGQRLILDIPLSEVSALIRGSNYLGGYFFTLRQGDTMIDMCAIYGGKAFVDNLEKEIVAAGGQL